MIENVEIGIANFKPFGERTQRFKLKPITLIYGPNSIGKSSVIHSIAYLQSIFKNQDFNPSEIGLGDKISIGGFQQFVHKKEVDRGIALEFKFDTGTDIFNTIDSAIDNHRTSINKERRRLINLVEEKTMLKNRLLNLKHDEIKKKLFHWLDEIAKDQGSSMDSDWELMLMHYSWDDDIFSFVRLYEHIHFFEKLSDFSEQLSSKNWENEPMENLRSFLDQASSKTKDFFHSISPLYVNDNKEYIEFNYSLFAEKLLVANSSVVDDLVIDIMNDMNRYLNSKEYITETIPEKINDCIKVKTIIKLIDDNTVQDIQTQYFVGNELLIESNLIKRQENIMSNDKNITHGTLEKDEIQSKKAHKDLVYEIKLYSNHWFVQNVLEDINYNGDWITYEGKPLNEKIRQNIYSNLENVIYYHFDDIDMKSSILLDYTNEKNHYIQSLLGWSPECENTAGPLTDLLQDDYKTYMNSAEFDEEYDDYMHDVFIEDRISKNAKLFQYLRQDEKNQIKSLNDVLMKLFYNWAQTVNSTIRDNERPLHYIGPLRFFPERYDFSFSEKVTQEEDSQSTWQLLRDSEDAKDKLNSWLSGEKLKTPYEIQFQKHILINNQTVEKIKEIIQKNPEYPLEEIEKEIPYIKEMSFYDKRYDTQVNIREMGLGISQILPVLVNLFQKTNKLIAVEQPELHLHPSVQSDLADEFIKSYKKNNNISLIETHSEHLLLRIMRRMRQTNEGTLDDEELALSADDVSLLYVDADANKTYIMELELSDDGSLLDPWPGGFFEEGFKERFF